MGASFSVVVVLQISYYPNQICECFTNIYGY